MKITTKQQAINAIAQDLTTKFQAVNQLQSMSGIHLGAVKIIACEGYGVSERSDDVMYTPSERIQVDLIVSRSTQGRLMIDFFKVNGEEIMRIPVGGAYISNVVKKVKTLA